MRVGIIQSSYLPWRGYLDLIRQVDLFLFYDDSQYSKQSWRNRNRIKTATGWRWLTVPVKHQSLQQRVDEVEISYNKEWRQDHLNQLDVWYKKAPFHTLYRKNLEEILDNRPLFLSDLNHNIILWFLDELKIRTPIRLTSEIISEGQKTDRLIEILKNVGARTYLSGPAAKNYIEVDKFRDAGINLEYKTYDYSGYSQQWGAFEPQLSTIDLLMNLGPEARNHITSLSPNEVVTGMGRNF